MLEVTNNDQLNDELLPCPFCGTAPVWYCKGNVDYIMRKRTIVIKCPFCGTRQETSVLKLPTKMGAMMAITKWNMRTESNKEDEK
jgi:transcription elongation factor Elf1